MLEHLSLVSVGTSNGTVLKCCINVASNCVSRQENILLVVDLGVLYIAINLLTVNAF